MSPRLLQMPLPVQRYDDPFLPFGKATIDATQDLLCGYMFDLAAYLAIGAAGAVALERTIAYAGQASVNILHGPFPSPDYAEAAGAAAFNVDAVTLTESIYAENYLRTGVEVLARDGVGEVGVFSQENSTLTIHDVVLRLLGDDVLYAGRGNDFADAVRAAVEAQLQ
jgi:hypothetical protein